MSKIRIGLVPSNQLANIGVGGYNEALAMNKLVKAIAEKLKKEYGDIFEVFYKKLPFTLNGAIKYMNDKDVQFVVHYHTDASGTASTSGAIGFYKHQDSIASNNYKFARIQYDALKGLCIGEGRGLQKDNYYSRTPNGLSSTQFAHGYSTLQEIMFHTNPLDVKRFKTKFDAFVNAGVNGWVEVGKHFYPDKFANKGAFIVLKKGIICEKGRVTMVQRKLKMFRLYKGEPDGVFGPLTEAAVIAYQKKFLPDIKRKGVVGEITYTDLMNRKIPN